MFCQIIFKIEFDEQGETSRSSDTNLKKYEGSIMERTIDTYLKQMVTNNGSDLHLPSGYVPMVRIHGELLQSDHPNLDPDFVKGMALEIMSQEDQDKLFEDANVDFVYQMDDPHSEMNRFRTNVFFQKNGINIVCRGIPRTIPTLQTLGLPESLGRLTQYHQGMVLVTGPSGCGKTATLAALINLINQNNSVHVISVEEPIEYVHENMRSLIVQRQVGRDVDKFATALKAALREDPDVIMVGEMRDLETIQLAITAAETGHLVFATLHTNGAIQTITRIIDAFPQEQQSQIRTMFSESLRGVISQHLIPRKDGMGRVVAYEILYATPSIANLIRDNKIPQMFSAMQMGRAHGMVMMDDTLMELVQKGIISEREGLDRATDPKTFEETLKKPAEEQLTMQGRS
jgi:twitching motility protein PilT